MTLRAWDERRRSVRLNRLSALWTGTIAAFVLLGALAAVRAADWSYGADTGTFVQIVLDAFGGMHNGVERTTHYRFHWSPTLILLWPFLAATHSLWVLQTILAAATVACAPLVAAIARGGVGLSGPLDPGIADRTGPAERTAATRIIAIERGVADRIGAVALVYPPLVAVGFGEFRDLGLLPALALGWWLAMQRRSWRWVAVCALLLAGLREDVCLELAIIGIVVAVVALRNGDRATMFAALGSAGLAVVSDATYALVVLPRVGPWPPSHFYTYPFANGPAELLLAPLTHPLAFFAAILTLGRLTYVLEALVPLAFIPLRTRMFLLSIPGFAIVLLANSGLVWRMGMHYAALWIPWLLIAFAAGIATLRLQRRWTTIAFVLSAVVLIAFSPLHPLHYLKPSYHALGDARTALACVPANARVATHDEWYTAVAANRPGAMVLGEPPFTRSVDYVVVADDFPNTSFQSTVLPYVNLLVARRAYVPACRAGHVTTYALTGMYKL
jgi:uncharacterized membrane protein